MAGSLGISVSRLSCSFVFLYQRHLSPIWLLGIDQDFVCSIWVIYTILQHRVPGVDPSTNLLWVVDSESLDSYWADTKWVSMISTSFGSVLIVATEIEAGVPD